MTTKNKTTKTTKHEIDTLRDLEKKVKRMRRRSMKKWNDGEDVFGEIILCDKMIEMIRNKMKG